uniref:REJ domain-containing protein n=1 Tax=Ascaris lumbricoides TaxID=6252 RepID=A0A0M3HZX2_ASCLU
MMEAAAQTEFRVPLSCVPVHRSTVTFLEGPLDSTLGIEPPVLPVSAFSSSFSQLMQLCNLTGSTRFNMDSVKKPFPIKVNMSAADASYGSNSMQLSYSFITISTNG